MTCAKENKDGICVVDCIDHAYDSSTYRAIPGLEYVPDRKKDGHYLAIIQCGNCFYGTYLFVPQELSIAESLLERVEKSPTPHPYPNDRNVDDGVCWLCKRPFVKQQFIPKETNND